MSIGVKQYNVGLNGSMILTSSLLLNLSNSDQTRAGFLATMRTRAECTRPMNQMVIRFTYINGPCQEEEDMPNGTRKQRDDAQLRAAIMKEAEEPRQAASVKKALEKTPATTVREKLGGSTGWKAKTAKRRKMNACKPDHPARPSR